MIRLASTAASAFTALAIAVAPSAAKAPRAPVAPSATAQCDESCLLGMADAYMDALTANDAGSLPFATTVRSTENGVAMVPGKGIWTTATAWQYRHSFVDQHNGAIGVYGIVTEGTSRKAFVTIRLKVVGRRIAESEMLVAHEGDFSLFNPVETEAKPIFGEFVPADRQSSREQLMAIAHSYFDGITRGDASAVPFHPDCNRVENGFQTTNSPPRITASCSEGLQRFSYMHSYRELRFPVVDPARGLVWAITAFDLPLDRRTVTIRGKPFEITPERQHLPRTLFLYELFKIEGGRIRAIEAQMRDAPLGTSMGWAGKP